MNLSRVDPTLFNALKSVRQAHLDSTSLNTKPMDDNKLYSFRYARTEITALSRYLGTGINALAFTGDTFLTSLMLILRQKKRVALGKSANAKDGHKIKMEIFQHMVNVCKFDDMEDLKKLGGMLKIKEAVIKREADFDLPTLDLDGVSV